MFGRRLRAWLKRYRCGRCGEFIRPWDYAYFDAHWPHRVEFNRCGLCRCREEYVRGIKP